MDAIKASVLEKLIRELCPEGVEYRELSELFKTKNGYTPSKGNKEFWENGNIPWFRMDDIRQNGGILSRALQNVTEKAVKGEVFPENSLIVATSATIGEHALITVPSLANQRFTYLLLKEEYKNKFEMRFLYYYCFKLDEYCKSNLNQGNFASVDMGKFSKFKFPLPPLPIQQEIVRILDTFTNLTAELTAELTARRKQYEYYRDELLTFGEDVAWTTLKCIADIGTGSSNTNEGLKEGKYPFFVRSQEPLRKNEYEYDETAIITAGDGVGVGKVYHFYEGKYALHQRAYRIHVNTEAMYPKFVFHYMRAKFLPYIEKTMFHGSVSSIRRPMLNKFPIPVLKVCDQKQIADILDKFDKLCEDISEGIPAEISARQKQYEYYRDQLLTFKRIGA